MKEKNHTKKPNAKLKAKANAKLKLKHPKAIPLKQYH
jgi:hypothetical protein